ncbi:PREDICTED: putative disease resistance protein At4g11170 [Camelina sativa]|uniref:Disease resistance protein At4g11170 n=1 Tax=Camelina sativa TaxID=90675 RepID=A0ABM1QKN3_CAMSA|nr:PREDICTED: putative disease resistance protein At4g11170 [Camelina sativa]
MSKEEWIKALPRLRTSLNGKIEKVLEVCYDGLDEEDKAIFLHNACLFNGEKVDRVKQLLAKRALDAEFGLKVLVDRSLIHICADRYIVMHCLLQQLVKKLLGINVLMTPGHGTEIVLGISLDMSEIEDQVYISENAFKKMPNLQFLRLYKNFLDDAVKLYLPQGLDYLPRKLRLLHWDSYPIKCMPSKFCLEYLVELTMRESKLEKLWEGIQPLTSLKYMDLSASTNIEDIPNLLRATNLEKLYLRSCENMVTVPSSAIQNLDKLKVLDMSCCIKLKNLPTNINLESLSVLNLRGCSRLKTFPLISTHIQFMSLGETAIEKVPSLIKLCSRLVSMEMAGCKNLKILTSFPTSMEIVDISWTGVEVIDLEHMHIEHMRKPYVCVFENRCYSPILR